MTSLRESGTLASMIRISPSEARLLAAQVDRDRGSLLLAQADAEEQKVVWRRVSVGWYSTSIGPRRVEIIRSVWGDNIHIIIDRNLPTVQIEATIGLAKEWVENHRALIVAYGPD